ncbi:MAG TPA: SRPBCC domain-containing protein [Flavisolibacter sp.]|nr:SRPBCC domain-containing protein [Flavisolibacter sp.]
MIINKETIYTKDATSKKINVTREFEAPVKQVWKAWTERDLLDQWWAPKPWKANTVSMDFRNGGTWLYYMQGPDGSQHYCRIDYNSIVPNKSYESLDAFTDESGNINTEFPRMKWKVEFNPIETGIRIYVEISFDSAEDLEKIIEMGFREGFAMAHNNLDELLATQSQQYT